MRKQMVHSLLSLLLIQSVLPSAWAQIGEGQTAEEGQTANDSRIAEKILIARHPYTQHEDVPRGAGDTLTLSERAQSRPVPVVSPHIRYPRRRDYEGTWRQPGNGRHALIGAVIGFGLGAAIGAKGNQDQHTRARIAVPVLFGGAGALIGAAIGANHP
jgi:hypothetical protein